MYVMTLLLNAVKIMVYYYSKFATYIAIDNFTIYMVTIMNNVLEYIYGHSSPSGSYYCSYFRCY